jgi:SAM-dependent methyltransferase
MNAMLAYSLKKFLAGRYQRWQEASLDRRYGIDTCGIDDDLASLGAAGEHLAQAYGYEPLHPPEFPRMMRAARIDPRRYVFVDFGSGKGRAVVLAAEYGFQRVIGVELAPALHEVAQRNIETFRRRRPRAGRIELHCGDAVDLPIPDGDALFFFYNPFADGVLRKVAANIERSFRQRPRNVVVAYRNPVHWQVFEALGFLRRAVQNKSFALYWS